MNGSVAVVNKEEDETMKLKLRTASAMLSVAGAVAVGHANDAISTDVSETRVVITEISTAPDKQISSRHILISEAAQNATVTVRTERYPRLPSSGATYYIYEQSGQVICTKLAVCDKYGICENEYRAGVFKAEQDTKILRPYGASPPVPISSEKLSKHACLVKYVKGIR